jgi:arginase
MDGAWTLLGAPLDSSGAGRGEERAPAALRAAGLADRLGLHDAGDVVPPLRDPVRDPSSGVIALGRLVVASARLRDAVADVVSDGGRPFVLGGDCSLLPGALAGARLAAGPLGLWMVDGHPDALDGATSPTGEAADMDLAVVTGRGAPSLRGLAGQVPIVPPDRVALIGHRPPGTDPDADAELALIPPEVRQVTAPEVRRRGPAAVAEATLGAVAGPAWLHLDLDVLDQDALPAVTYEQPRGLRWDELTELLAPLLADPGLTGVSLADFRPDRDPGGVYAGRVIDALAEAWPAG